MARFVVVLPLVPLAAGDEFTVAQWPLHITLVEPFPTSLPADDVARVLDGVEGIGAGAPAIHAAAGDEAMFGRRRDVPVTLVRDGGELAALRSRTLAALQRAGIDVQPRLDFRPHVTRKQHGRSARVIGSSSRRSRSSTCARPRAAPPARRGGVAARRVIRSLARRRGRSR